MELSRVSRARYGQSHKGLVGSPSPEPLLSCHFPAVVRKLQEFELPYVSVTSLHNPEFRIILRKR